MSCKITGNIVNAFIICKRKAWLYAREINSDSENVNLELGRIIGENTYKREKKELLLPGMKIDFMKKSEGSIIVAEVKKSSKGEKAAIMQLLFYLYNLSKKGINAKGELLIPKERKKRIIELDEKSVKELKSLFAEMEEVLKRDTPPKIEKGKFCKNCAFNEFCWAELDGE